MGRIYTATRTMSGRGSVDPRDLSAAIMALDERAVVLDGSGNVSTWTDGAGLTHSPTNATTTKRPAWTTNQLNGYPIARFDGTDDFLATSFTNAQPMEAWIVFKNRAIGLQGINDVVFDGATAAKMTLISCSDAGLRTIVHAGSNLIYDTIVCNNVFGIIGCVYNSTSSMLYVNGARVVTGDANVSAGGATGVTLGALAGGTRCPSIDVACMYLYGRPLFEGERSQQYNYLKAKYAL